MNKYNVRAIRNELDGYVRNCSWKKFRCKFGSLLPNLQQAISDKRKNQSSLLHSLCRCVHAHPPVPIDVLESVIRASPKKLFQNSPTPLSVALDRQASLLIIECLLKQCSEALYICNSRGDTPILQAVRQAEESLNPRLWDLLVRYDPTGQSLLIPSKKRHRVPLFYVAYRELSYVNLEREDDLSEELEFLLLQTFQAKEFQERRISRNRIPTSIPSNENCYSYEDSKEYTEYCYREKDEPNGALLRATITCADYMGTKITGKILEFFKRKVSKINIVDKEGNNLLHLVCRSTCSFWGSGVAEGTSNDFLEYLIQKYPEGLMMENAEGELPLHLAIRTKKCWSILSSLCKAAPDSCQWRNRMALHGALIHYHDPSSQEVMELWKVYPEAATTVEGSTRLFPFQLAAIIPPASTLVSETTTSLTSECTKETRKFSSKDELPSSDAELNQLNAIFFFLQAWPQVLRKSESNICQPV